ncbi:MAG TPA: hypothetical protein PLR52_07825 [Bacteroidales bacterium]|nr:hypothetical protein [Bacteroidales bacterium]HPR73931.1 hypothetical protein [Bacteroidales bacterium]
MIKRLLTHYPVAILLGLIAVFLLFNKLFIWGLAAVGIAFAIVGIQKLIDLNVKVLTFQDNVKNLSDQNIALQKQNISLSDELNYLRDRHFQITQIKSILDMNLFEIFTKFTRTISKEEEVNERKIKYFGSLNVSITAKYGIDCKELRFKYIENENTLLVANITPKFLSFGTRNLEWDFFEILEYRRQNRLAEKRWMTSDDLHEYANKIKEDIRVNTEKSLEKGPEEFSWIYAPIRQNAENTIRILFGGFFQKIKIVENFDKSFYCIDNLSSENYITRNSLKQNSDKKAVR